MSIHNPNNLRDLLERSKVIAVVGHSEKSYRTSYRIAQYLREAGYKVYAVNPTVDQIDGEKSYPNLAAIPESIDIVDVFRRSEHLQGIVEDAIAAKAKAIWTQLGIIDPKAAQRAVEAGLDVVMDRCIMVDHRQLLR
jgi:predicted CoA-binding protein